MDEHEKQTDAQPGNAGPSHEGAQQPGAGAQSDQEPETESDMRARMQEKLKDFESKFREKVKDLDETVRAEFRDAVPAHVSAHLQKSKEEFLLAVRGIIDRQVEKIRTHQQNTPQSAEAPPSPEAAPPPPPPPSSSSDENK